MRDGGGFGFTEMARQSDLFPDKGSTQFCGSTFENARYKAIAISETEGPGSGGSICLKPSSAWCCALSESAAAKRMSEVLSLLIAGGRKLNRNAVIPRLVKRVQIQGKRGRASAGVLTGTLERARARLTKEMDPFHRPN